jgi:putative oxidoreductase
VPVTLIFHGFWRGAAEFQNQLNHFLKNVAVFGGLLALFDVERQRATSAARVNVLRSRAA